MFHFPTFPPHALCVQARVTPHDWCGVPPFGHPRINARLAAPRGLSQPPTSFIGSWCPGIHRAPLKTWPHNNPPPHDRPDTGQPPHGGGPQTWNSSNRVRRCSRPLCSSQRPTHEPPPWPRQTHTPTSMRRYDTGTAPDRESHPPRPLTDRTGPLLPQDPTACLQPATTPTPTFHAPTPTRSACSTS